MALFADYFWEIIRPGDVHVPQALPLARLVVCFVIGGDNVSLFQRFDDEVRRGSFDQIADLVQLWSVTNGFKFGLHRFGWFARLRLGRGSLRSHWLGL